MKIFGLNFPGFCLNCRSGFTPRCDRGAAHASRRRDGPKVKALAALVLLAVASSAQVAQPLDPYQPPVKASQTLRLWGDRHLEPLARAWAKAYAAAHPDIHFEIQLLGNGTAMPALYLGRADIALFGRDLIVTDRDAFNHTLKYDPLRIELATGSVDVPGEATALVLFVHRDNPLTRLTLAQVDAIFSARRFRGAPRQLRTWGDLGLTGEWADRPIHLYADDTQSMAALFFQRVALGDSRMMNWENFTEFGDVRRPDGSLLLAAEQSMAALRADRYGLAVSNLHYADTQVKPLALAPQEGGDYFPPTRENIASRRYPLARPVFACVNRPPGRPLDPKVRDFLRFVISAAGQQVITETGGYLPLATDAVARELAKLP